MHLFERPSRVLFGVKRKRGAMLREALAIRVISIFFLKPRRIRQHYFKQVSGRRRSVNRTRESIADQPRQVTGVIYVSVSEQGPGYRSRIDRQRLPIA